MTEKQVGTLGLWGIALFLIICGLGGLYSNYAQWRIQPVSVNGAGNALPEMNVNISDGYADFASAVDGKDANGVYAVVPIRSRKDPNAAVSLVTIFSSTKSSDLKRRTNALDLVGQIGEPASDLPKGKLQYDSHVSQLYLEISTPYAPKRAGDILFMCVPIIFGVILILIAFGVGNKSLFQRKRDNLAPPQESGIDS